MVIEHEVAILGSLWHDRGFCIVLWFVMTWQRAGTPVVERLLTLDGNHAHPCARRRRMVCPGCVSAEHASCCVSVQAAVLAMCRTTQGERHCVSLSGKDGARCGTLVGHCGSSGSSLRRSRARVHSTLVSLTKRQIVNCVFTSLVAVLVMEYVIFGVLRQGGACARQRLRTFLEAHHKGDESRIWPMSSFHLDFHVTAP